MRPAFSQNTLLSMIALTALQIAFCQADAKCASAFMQESTANAKEKTAEGEKVDAKKAEDETSEDETSESKASVQDATPSLTLRQQVSACLGYYHETAADVTKISPWDLMHFAVAYGKDTEFIRGKKRINGIDWLCGINGVRGNRMLNVDKDGKLSVEIAVHLQGHHGQLLSVLAQSDIAVDKPIEINGDKFTLADLIEVEKETCKPKSELTFKLIAFCHYLSLDDRWENEHGEWNIERLLTEELAQTIDRAACRGSHRLCGLAAAVLKKKNYSSEPLDGVWLKAQKKVEEYIKYAFAYQNEDGSFSGNWFSGKNNHGDINQRLNSTGHMLEFIVGYMSVEQLKKPRIKKVVKYLSQMLLEYREFDWHHGYKGHALHALAMYEEKVFDEIRGEKSYEFVESSLPEMKKKTIPNVPTQRPTYTRPLFGRLFRQ